MSDPFVESMWASASKTAASGGSFVSTSELRALDTLSPAQIDALPYGVVKLDDRGIVSIYNKYEADLASFPQAAAAGKNFFVDVAPCTNNKVFRGCFAKGVELKGADCVFSYTFTYNMRPTEVKVHLHRSATSNWLLIKKK